MPCLPRPKKKPPLKFTQAQRQHIYDVVAGQMAPDDREPSVVIKDRYKGNEDAWLADMVKMHRIKLKDISAN